MKISNFSPQRRAKIAYIHNFTSKQARRSAFVLLGVCRTIRAEVKIRQFDDLVIHSKKEAIYLHNLLPQIVSDREQSLRNDFLANSGLGRITIEEIEREYLVHNDLDSNDLIQLRAE